MSSQSAAYVELSKFLALAVGRESEAYMFSPAVDAAWHDLVADASRYERFCSAFGVVQLGHIEAMGCERIPWIDDYHARFGKLPDIWFRDADNVLNKELYQDYLDNRTVHACWDCHPMPMPDAYRRVEDKPANRPTVPDDKGDLPSQEAG